MYVHTVTGLAIGYGKFAPKLLVTRVLAVGLERERSKLLRDDHALASARDWLTSIDRA